MFSWISELTAPYRKKLSALSTAMRVLIFASVSAVAVFISIAAVGARFAYKVSLEGEYIATVKSKEQFKAAVNIVKEKVTGDNVESKVSTPEYSAVIALNNDIDSNQNVAEAIIEKTEDIVLASDIKIEGTEIGYVNKDELQSVIDGIYAAKAPEGSTCSFVENVEISDGYCLASEVAGAEEAAHTSIAASTAACTAISSSSAPLFGRISERAVTRSIVPVLIVYGREIKTLHIHMKRQNSSAQVSAGTNGSFLIITCISSTMAIAARNAMSSASSKCPSSHVSSFLILFTMFSAAFFRCALSPLRRRVCTPCAAGHGRNIYGRNI